LAVGGHDLGVGPIICPFITAGPPAPRGGRDVKARRDEPLSAVGSAA
jgi:hypothetical protein